MEYNKAYFAPTCIDAETDREYVPWHLKDYLNITASCVDSNVWMMTTAPLQWRRQRNSITPLQSTAQGHDGHRERLNLRGE